MSDGRYFLVSFNKTVNSILTRFQITNIKSKKSISENEVPDLKKKSKEAEISIKPEMHIPKILNNIESE